MPCHSIPFNELFSASFLCKESGQLIDLSHALLPLRARSRPHTTKRSKRVQGAAAAGEQTGEEEGTKMSMAAGARAGARVLQQLRSPTPFFSRAQSLSPSSPPPSSLTPSRGLASDHGHGPAKVNMWEDPMSPAKWKEEHFVFASLAFWGAVFYGGFKAATGGKKKEAET